MIKALKELAKDSLTYGMADAIGKVIGFLLIPLYTAYLSPEDYGIISLLAYIYIFFTPLASLGITNAIFRRFNLHQEKADQYMALSTGSIFMLFTSLFLWGIGIFLAPQLSEILVGTKKYVILTQIALTGALFTSLGAVFQVILRAMRLVKTLSLVVIIKLTITISLTIYLVVFREEGVSGVIWANAIGACFATIVLLILCRKYLKRVFRKSELKALLNYGLPFLPHRLFSHFMIFLGPFFIKEFIGLSAAGLYDIALKFCLPLGFVVSAVQKSWVPLKFQIHRENTEEKSKKIFSNLISVYFIIIFVLFSAVLIIGPELLRLMADVKFHEAVYFFPFILLIMLGKSFYFMMGTGFEFTNDTRPMPLISLSGLLTVVILSLTFVDIIGIYGILISMSSCWFVMAFVMRRFANKRFFVPLNLSLILIVIIISVFGAILSCSLQKYEFWTRLLLNTFFGLAVLVTVFLTVKKNQRF